VQHATVGENDDVGLLALEPAQHLGLVGKILHIERLGQREVGQELRRDQVSGQPAPLKPKLVGAAQDKSRPAIAAPVATRARPANWKNNGRCRPW